MALRAVLSHGASDQRDISARIRANTVSVRSNAEEGSVAISNIIVDDPDGDLDIGGLIGLNLYESETPLAPGFYGGITADRTISRGDESKSFRVTDARQWEVACSDQNFYLSRHLFAPSNTAANRPAETDVERVTWLLTTSEMNQMPDTTFVNTSGGVAMDAADYRGQTAFDTLNDCALASGKNFFVYITTASLRGLWYDFADSTEYSSDIRISNVLSDVDETDANIAAGTVTTFAASFDTKLYRDPSRVYSGLYLPYDGGAVYQVNTATASNFIGRDTTAYSPNVKTAAKANARAIRMLASIATEEDRVTTTIKVPNAQVNDLKEGMRVQCRFTHLPDYEEFVWLRVLNRTVTQVSEYFYTITVELSGPGTPADPPVEPPASCLATNGTTYPLTPATVSPASGFYMVGITFTNDSTTLVQYNVGAGGFGQQYPTAGLALNWGDGGACGGTFSSGGVDYGTGGAPTIMRFTPVGPGTLTIETAANPVTSCGLPSTGYWTLFIAGTTTAIDTDSGFLPGDTITIDVPNDGWCGHYVDLYFASPWGYVGCEWTPA